MVIVRSSASSHSSHQPLRLGAPNIEQTRITADPGATDAISTVRWVPASKKISAEGGDFRPCSQKMLREIPEVFSSYLITTGRSVAAVRSQLGDMSASTPNHRGPLAPQQPLLQSFISTHRSQFLQCSWVKVLYDKGIQHWAGRYPEPVKDFINSDPW